MFRFEGREIPADPGASIGAALWAAGVRRFRSTRIQDRPRAIYCGIGQCYDCLVRVEGGPAVRACLTPAPDGGDVAPGDVR